MQVNASLPRRKDEDIHAAVNMKLFAWERTDSEKTLLLIVGQVKRECAGGHNRLSLSPPV